MFLDWINEINLLQHNPETNILLNFPYQTKRILINEITNCFIQQNHKTINNNLNTYINNYSDSPNLVIPNAQNPSLSTQSNSLNTKKSATNISASLIASPIAESPTSYTSTSLSRVESSNNINYLDTTNLMTVENGNDNESICNKLNNSYMNPQLDVASSKQDGNDVNSINIINTENYKESICESACTEAFITFPKIETNVPWTWLISVQHVQWVMEIIGQGFALPPTEENVKIIQNACAIYTQWLLDSTSRPYIIQVKEGKSVEQIFWQKIFHHFSLLFKINDKTTVYHQELCKQVLSVISMAERTLSSKFSEETWIILLKVLLGISDYLLREPLGKPNADSINISVMADRLCENIIRVCKIIKKFRKINK